jgi:Calcium-activated chloride channel
LVLKKFALKFVNRFGALLYCALWLQDIPRLQSLLTFLLIVSAIVGKAIERLVPLLMPAVSSMMTKKDDAVVIVSDDAPRLSDASTLEDLQAYWKAKLTKEQHLTTADVDDDYLQMILQYGYISLFTVCFPIAPLLALLNDLIEGRSDLQKYAQCKRTIRPNRYVHALGNFIIHVFACLYRDRSALTRTLTLHL